MDFEIIVGQRIKEQRKRLGISQQELAETVGYKGKDMISRIESGQIKAPMDKISEIAKALSMDIAFLLRDEEQTFIYTEDPFKGLSREDVQKVLDYIDLLKGAKQWQQQNGTERGGESGSHRTGK